MIYKVNYDFFFLQSIILRQFFSCLITLLLIIAYSIYENDKTLAMKYVGFLCCVMTIMFFAAPLASLMHVIQAKSAESLPFPIILMTFIVSMQWFIYGVLLSDRFIQVIFICSVF